MGSDIRRKLNDWSFEERLKWIQGTRKGLVGNGGCKIDCYLEEERKMRSSKLILIIVKRYVSSKEILKGEKYMGNVKNI